MEIRVPTFPESVTEGTLITWHVQPGDIVLADQIIAEVETDKVVFEVPSPVSGILTEHCIAVDESVESEQLIATIEEKAVEAPPAADMPVESSPTSTKIEVATTVATTQASAPTAIANAQTSPAVRKLMTEQGLSKTEVIGSGKHGRITKHDVVTHQPAPTATAAAAVNIVAGAMEERVPMSRIRKRIAQRLLQSSNETAMLTTFNEVNMQPIMDARSQYKDLFERQHGTKMGFMSFFVKAACQALLRHPDVNASIDGDDLIYHGYCDIGVAVSTDRGLVVPILRQAENMTFAEIESGIADFAGRARENKLSIDDLTGGTFSITNGGVFGSLMSTPIINPPQAAILGMHAIKPRPVAENNQVVIRPMMYLALSYDHRIIDGKTSVTFLRNIKEMLEDPIRLAMNI